MRVRRGQSAVERGPLFERERDDEDDGRRADGMKWKLPGGLCGGECMKEAGSGRSAALSFRRTRAGCACEL